MRGAGIDLDLNNLLFKKYIESSNCFVAISSDGITSNDFIITRSDGLFLQTSLSIQDKKSFSCLGRTFSIAKNLDYYQNKICQLVKPLPDTNDAKLNLQIMRVAIIAMLLRLVNIIHTQVSESKLVEWNRHADSVLTVVSDPAMFSTQPLPHNEVATKIRAKTLLYIGIDLAILEGLINTLYRE